MNHGCLHELGYQLVRPGLTSGQLNKVRRIRALNSVNNSRDLHKDASEITQLVHQQPVSNIIEKFLGQHYLMIRALYFNKNQTNNWPIAWHQDKTLVVSDTKGLSALGDWKQLNGRCRLEPTEEQLRHMIAVRIHLDDTTLDNGCLQVIPESHKLGILAHSELEQIVSKQTPQLCIANAGDILVMRPLLLHRSGRVSNVDQRRVIHIEFTKLINAK